MKRTVNGTATTLRTVTAGQGVTTAKQWVRLRVVGSTMQFKIWRDGQAEPTAWTSSLTDTGLTTPGQFFLSVVRGGSNSGSKSVSFDDLVITGGGTVTPPPDTTPPTVPTGLNASNVGQNQVTVGWSASTDNVGVVGYDVLRNGSVVATAVPALSFTDTGLTPSTAYSYSVRAVDAAGLRSASSTALGVTTASPPTGSTLFTDQFTAANGSPWGSGWATTANNGSATVQSNAGRLSFNDTAGAYARAQLTGVGGRADSAALFSYQWSAGSSGAYLNVFLRGSGGWQNTYRPLNGYGLEFSSGSSTISVKRNVNGVTTTLGTVAGAQSVGTQKQWLRLRVVGSTVQFKSWVDGTAEPATWRATFTDTQVSAPGQLHISMPRSSSNVGNRFVTIDDLTVTSGD